MVYIAVSFMDELVTRHQSFKTYITYKRKQTQMMAQSKGYN